MANEHTDFWLALLDLEDDPERLIRLWNGYLGWRLTPKLKGQVDQGTGWPQLRVDPPDGGWPELTAEEMESLDELADGNGGHPKLGHGYMDFSDQIFFGALDLSGLILIWANFNRARFGGEVNLSEKTRFYAQASFGGARFEENFFCDRAQFEASVSFTEAYFGQFADFNATEFKGGAYFTSVTFDGQVTFNDSRFEERWFSHGISIPYLTDFAGAKFKGRTSFRNVVFGNTEAEYSRDMWPERRVNFTDAEFEDTTDFRGASFGGAPAFFNAKLHEDTDFSGIDWRTAENKHVPVEYAVRAWERLELMMSKLEKPFDRHRFFRLKMRARRRKDGRLLRTLSWLFEKTSDYGWGVGRAGACWLGHWVLFSAILFANACAASCCGSLAETARASIGAGFANAHAFLFLTAEEGYLDDSLALLRQNDGLGLVSAVGVTEAILGPIFLFLVLLTLRNRFRLG